MASSSIVTLLCISFLCLRFASAATNITTTDFLRDDSETLVSDNSVFKLGFFSPVNSTNRYVGIWFSAGELAAKEVVWVANRNNPIKDSSGVLKISEDGNLELSDRQNMTVWSSNVTDHANSTAVARLLDTGNFVLVSSDSGKIIWQSFEHLTDSLLQQTNITINPELGTGNPVLQSWKSASDPSIGRFEVGLIPSQNTEFVTVNDGKTYWRSGPWNGSHFLGLPYTDSDIFRIMYDDHEGTLNVYFSAINETLLAYFKLSHDGTIFQRWWEDGVRMWVSGWQSIATECDVFDKCGQFGRCNSIDSPVCNCLDGFKPKNDDEWSEGNWTSGCGRKTQLQCGIAGGTEDGFSHLRDVKVPFFPSFESPADHDSCSRKCLESCSCLAYAFRKDYGCMIWNKANLIDIQVFSADGVDLFIRLAHSELVDMSNTTNKKGENRLKIIIAVTSTLAATICVVFAYCMWSWMYRRYDKRSTNTEAQIIDSEVDTSEFKDLLPLYKLEELEVATNNFSDVNMLGRGGFGSVYKAKLKDGQEIAVKRLSRASGQGLQEFMNEVVVISKLQHKNLVKLLGCCVEREEKLLVYECMPNNSLDALLFDSQHKIQLDWKKRFNIINGICRGLLYLHRDSRLKIIHRDLKASNILLDENFNAKISDFGMARIFESNQDQANTLRVVGTYGYMSPEYAMEGRFSEKSDIFSLGVLLLEIVSGRKNSSFLNNEFLSLLTYAWKLWTENDILSLIDPTIYDPCFEAEILKCIQLGLLCVQEYPEDRPTISALISMLDGNDVTELPHPTQPGFTHRKMYSTDEIQSSQEYGSVNHVSITAFSGR